jgi:predicted Zn finger-like uncharacterized protein
MPFETFCPDCGAVYLLIDQVAGRKVRCKVCEHVFTARPEAGGRAEVKPVDADRPELTSAPPPPSPRLHFDPVDFSRTIRGKSRRLDVSSRPFLWPLLVGGVAAGLILLLGIAGVAAWVLTRAPIPAVADASPVAEVGPAKPPEEPRAAIVAAPAKGLEDLKAATVYIRVTAGPMRASGSGFLVKVDGNTGYVVTNAHVVRQDGPARAARRGVFRAAAPLPEITLVFRSGTKQELSVRAEVVAVDRERDLAVLKVAGVASFPRPIDISGPPNLVETLPVTVLGFPFGEALGLGGGNPSISVSKGSISSIRRGKDDEVVAVQIDGALNPGNSGGPVVDPEGRLVGVAVATIRGAHIGLAVPGGALSRMLEGGVGEVRAVARNMTDANAEIEVEVPLIDPLGRIQSVTVHYLRSDLAPDNPQPDKAGAWPELAGSQRVALRLDGRRAVGTFVILAADRDKSITFQTSYVDGAGRQVYTRPFPMRVASETAPVVAQRPPVPGLAVRPSENPPQARSRPIKRPPPIVYQAYVPRADKEQVPLSGPAGDLAVGGGGRYLILRLAGKKKLAVFDVQQGKVAGELPLAEEPVHFAAGAGRLVVVYPGAKLLQLWSLATLARERSALLPGTLTSDTIHQICMGSASAGPLFVYLPREKRTLTVDLDSLATTEVSWSNWAPNNAYGPLNMRASPDGSLLAGWGGGWAGCEVAMFNDGLQAGSNPKIEFWATDGTYALPSADARFIFTPWGILNRAFAQAKVPELKDAYVVPAIEPGYFIGLANTCSPGAPPPQAQAASEAAVYTEDRKQLFFLRGLDELKTPADLPWEKRIHYYPRSGLLVTLGAERDRLLLRRVNLAEQLEKTGADYLVVLSEPPPARAGQPFAYQLDIRSKRGGVKAKLESGPKGLQVTPDGQVSWAVPAKLAEREAEVLLTLRDASGQEVFHTFRVEIAER